MPIFKIVYSLFVLFFFTAECVSADLSQTIKNDFSELQAALLSGTGKKAANLVTPETIAMYERGRKLALSSDGVDFENVLQSEVLLIFQLRYHASKVELKKMRNKDVFAWGVSNGLVKKDTLSALELDHVQIEDDKAFATLRKAGQPVPDTLFSFIKGRNNRWLLDMIQISNALEPVFQKIRNKAGKTKVELAIYLLERTYGAPIPPAILNGPLK